MKTYLYNVLALLVAISILLGGALTVRAATLFMLPTGGSLKVGQSIDLEVRVDTQGKSFNAVEGTVRFDKENFEVVEVDSSPQASVLTFWLKQPEFSNSEGTISFAGGTVDGVSGASVPILKFTLRAKAEGESDVVIGDASVAASDGAGTNILSITNISRMTIKPGAPVSDSKPGTTAAPKEPVKTEGLVAQPVQITRTPTEATKKPAEPVVKVALYPEGLEWSNRSVEFTSTWDLPTDITGVSTELTTDPKSVPPTVSEGLFESKDWLPFGDGVRYLRVRFKNSIGWGPAVTKKISIDTRPPLPIDTKVLEGDATDNPTPTIEFRTKDALSGLKNFEVLIDTNPETTVVPASTSTVHFQPKPLTPGTHSITIRAIDNAENRTEKTISLEIIPIRSPVISLPVTKVFTDAPDFSVRGNAIPNSEITLSLVSRGLIVSTETARADSEGVWAFTFTDPLAVGSYTVRATARDARGAQSLAVDSPEIFVENRPILQIGSFSLDMVGVVILLVVVLVLGFISGLVYFRHEREKLSMRVGFTQSESSKMFAMLKSDIEQIKGSKTDALILKKVRDTIEKMDVYMHRGIGKIKS